MSGPMVQLVAGIASVLFSVVIVLQLLIAVGIVPITIAWGGRQEKLTVPLRIASVAAAVILGIFGYVIRFRAGLVGNIAISPTIRVLAWVISAFLALNTLGNLTSKSRGERLLFGPITIILTVACFLVASSSVV